MLKKRFKKLFIPHEENGYKPDFLERFSIGVMMILVIISFAIANIQALVWVSSEWLVSAVLPSVIVDLTNDGREEDSLVTLKRNSLLDAAAQMKADDMAAKGYFAHYSPDGTSPWYWFDQASYDYTKAGENLAVHFNDSNKLVKAWMNSPSHRANIMNGAYTEIGIGTAKGEYKGSKTVFVVQFFGTPNTSTVITNNIVSNIETSSTSSVPQLVFAEETIDDILGEETVEIEIQSTTSEEVSSSEVVAVNSEAYIEKEVIENNEITIIYSDTATTSREIVPSSVDTGGIPPVELTVDSVSISNIAKTITQPSIWLQMVYAVLAIIVVVALIMSVVIEWRRQNPIQLAYAGSLLAVMALLFQVHTVLTSGVTIL